VDVDEVVAQVVGVELDLVEVGHEAQVEQLLQVGRLEVGGADRLDQPRLEQAHQALEGLHVAALVGVRPVHQQQVDVVEAEALEAGLTGRAGAVDAVPFAVELGGDEDIRAGHTGLADALAHAALVFVVLGGVDEPVAHVEGGGHRDGGFGVVHGPGAQAELGHLDAVGQGQGRCGVDALSHSCRPIGWEGSPILAGKRSRFITLHGHAAPAARTKKETRALAGPG
jgi:hypothetical protein